MRTNYPRRAPRGSREAGQAIILVLLALGLFLLGAIAFAVDMGNLWFHRQATQNAADAACTAAAMDVLARANGSTTAGGFTPGTTFKCSGNTTAAPCVYAAKNGATAKTLVAGQPGYDVTLSFPSTVAGVPTCSTGKGAPAICSASTVTAHPYVQVNVDDRAQLMFAAMLSGKGTTDVGAAATCGLVLSNAPVPILVLNPTVNGSLSGNGKITISIVGGPQRSIQVNSSSSSAVSISGGSGTIDLTQGGPNQNGSDFGVTGTEPQVGIFKTANTGQWIDPSAAISDPFATLPVPSVPSAPVRPSDLTAAQCPSIPCSVATGVHGCQDAPTCLLYTAGLYTSDIQSFKQTLIFDPGIYYMKANLIAKQQSCLRPGTGTGDGSGGTMFYFSGTHTVAVSANGGRFGVCGTTTKVPLSTVQCITTGLGATTLPAGVIANGGLNGNVLLGPCKAPTGGGTNYGDPLGAEDPLGEQRGMLFFQDRSANLAAAGNQPSWGGGGAFGLTGIMYFHYCNSADGAGLGSNCNPGAYTDQLSLQGGSASNTFVVGDIITDELSLGGNPTIEMDLNPNALYYVLKATLLK